MYELRVTVTSYARDGMKASLFGREPCCPIKSPKTRRVGTSYGTGVQLWRLLSSLGIISIRLRLCRPAGPRPPYARFLLQKIHLVREVDRFVFCLSIALAVANYIKYIAFMSRKQERRVPEQ